jgi:hypothetical protein
MRNLILGSPKLASLKGSEFLKILSEEDDPLKALFAGPMRKHLEKSLDPSPEQVAKVYDTDLQGFFKKVYSKPEMTDVVWLHAFRILPTRMLRQRMFSGPGGSIWTGDMDHILKWIQMFADVGDKYQLEHSLGFWGAKHRLPEREILEFNTMCGHGMVSFNFIRKLIEYVKLRRLTPKEAAKIMAKCCECGVFNPIRAEFARRCAEAGFIFIGPTPRDHAPDGRQGGEPDHRFRRRRARLKHGADSSANLELDFKETEDREDLFTAEGKILEFPQAEAHLAAPGSSSSTA